MSPVWLLPLDPLTVAPQYPQTTFPDNRYSVLAFPDALFRLVLKCFCASMNISSLTIPGTLRGTPASSHEPIYRSLCSIRWSTPGETSDPRLVFIPRRLNMARMSLILAPSICIWKASRTPAAAGSSIITCLASSSLYPTGMDPPH